MESAIRYFVINGKTTVMHIYGFCQQTKTRMIPIRLFESIEELQQYTARKLVLCKACRRRLEQVK